MFLIKMKGVFLNVFYSSNITLIFQKERSWKELNQGTRQGQTEMVWIQYLIVHRKKVGNRMAKNIKLLYTSIIEMIIHSIKVIKKCMFHIPATMFLIVHFPGVCPCACMYAYVHMCDSACWARGQPLVFVRFLKFSFLFIPETFWIDRDGWPQGYTYTPISTFQWCNYNCIPIVVNFIWRLLIQKHVLTLAW